MKRYARSASAPHRDTTDNPLRNWRAPPHLNPEPRRTPATRTDAAESDHKKCHLRKRGTRTTESMRKRRGEMNTWTTQANRLDRQRRQRERAERRAGNRLRKLLGHHRRLR